MLAKTNPTDPVDLHVGAKIRQRRKDLRISQEALGDGVGLTFQQIQKYERGANRVSASKLWVIAQKLEVPVAYFFEGLGEQPAGPLPVWRLDVAIGASAYIRAPDAQTAREKLVAWCERNAGIEVASNDVTISGRRYTDTRLPEVSLSPAMTIHGPDEGEMPTLAGT